jgi:hypothetical protein
MGKEKVSKILAWIIVSGLMIQNGFAANRYSAASGNWSSTSTWSSSLNGPAGASVPSFGDNVIIQKGFTVTIDIEEANCSNLTIDAPSLIGTSRLIINGNILNVSGNVTMSSTGLSKIASIDLSNGTLNISGNFTSTGSSINARIINVTASGGTINLSGNCNLSGVATLNAVSGSYFNYVGSGSQIVGGFAYANVSLQGSGLKILGGTASISEIISLQGTSTFGLSGNNLTYGPFSSLEYRGSSTQITTDELSATNSPFNIIINNPSGVILNANNVSINGALNLIYGSFDLNKNTFTVNNSSTSAITASSAGYIISEDVSLTGGKANNAGILRWNIGVNPGTFLFPFGTSSGEKIPVIITQTLEDAGIVAVSTYHTGNNLMPYPQTVNHVADATFTGTDNSSNTVNRFWNITNTGLLTSLNIKFSYFDDGNPSPSITEDERPINPTGGYETNIRAQLWDPATNTWLSSTATAPSGQISDAANNNVLALGVSKLGIFALAKAISPLPVQLISFTVIPVKDRVSITWSTASEINNEQFVVERSIDGQRFLALGVINGKNNMGINNYSFIDIAPLKGKIYYRLKQIDFNKKETLSELRVISFTGKNDKIIIGPNPVSKGQNISIKCPVIKSLVMINLMGEVIYKSQNPQKELNISTARLAGGVYYIKILSQNNEITTQKIVIQ